jgi:hypothetical protein
MFLLKFQLATYNMIKTPIPVIALTLSLLLMPFSLLAQETEENLWPQEIEAEGYLVVIYQPQPERLDGDRIYGRAAVALETAGKSEPIFGAIWFDARLVTDHDERTAVFEDIKIMRVRFPNEDKEKDRSLLLCSKLSYLEIGFPLIWTTLPPPWKSLNSANRRPKT